MTKYGRPLLIVTASLFIGFALALTPAKGGEVATNENQTLSQLLDENRTLGDQVSQLQEKLDEYEKTSAASDTVAAELAEELAAARMEAGLVPLTGPGIRIELDARYVSDAEGSRQAVRALSDSELLRIINELNASGAEAIAINGDRIVATSEIRTAGSYININRRATNVPYTIEAVGNPETLSASLMLLGGIKDTFEPFYELKITQVDGLEIPAYSGTLAFYYAQPVATP